MVIEKQYLSAEQLLAFVVYACLSTGVFYPRASATA